MNDQKGKWVNGLDSLRFILALIVMLSHLHDPVKDAASQSHSSFVRLLGSVAGHMFPGVVAVSGFFIISGFVIHYTTRHEVQLNTAAFLVRRWGRVGLPLLLLLVLSRFFGQGILSMVWSLYCELFFYTIYPLLRRLKLTWQVKMLLAWVVSLLVLGVFIGIQAGVFQLYGLGSRGVSWQLLVSLLNLPVWMMGILIAEKINEPVKVTAVRLWGLRVICYLVAMVIIALRMQYKINTLYTCLMVSPLLYLWLTAEIHYYTQHKANKVLEWCGRFSYSLYLWHLLAILVITKFVPLQVATYPVYILLVIVFSYIAYLLFERPSHMLARRLAKAIS